MKFNSFKEFYPYYLREHANRTCRQLHFVGTVGVLSIIVAAINLQNAKILFLIPVVGYGLAWIGHFVFEKNRPATFKHPFYSLLGDFQMFWDILRGKIKTF
ncbi:MAG: DUF962 domain-containing protein [Bacteriovoracaceae bacterium]|nr:DUF962 domain-containing protein [Bacteriovoracaceae bacterium]